MSVFVHDVAVFVTDSSEAFAKDVQALRDSMPTEFQPLLVGPVPCAINHLETYAFLPDGSKDGWDTSDQVDEYRRQFVAIFTDEADWGVEGVTVRFGNDLERDPIATDPRDKDV
jgi:hypothetical protein